MPDSITPPAFLCQSAITSELTLWFSTLDRVELTRTLFRSPLLADEIIAVRGKTCGAYHRTSVTFQWTSGVQGLCVLLLRASAQSRLGHHAAGPLLQGRKGSLASSLDSSIYKQTAWLDMFGVSVKGEPMARRIFKRSNAGLRHAGPVVLSLNENVLPRSAIRLHLDDRLLTDPHEILQHCKDIESKWKLEHFPVAMIPGIGPEHPLRR